MANATVAKRGQAVKTQQNAEQDAEACRLRSMGLSYRQVAVEAGCSVQVAYARVQRALKAIPAEAVEELRAVERERLDEMWHVAYSIMQERQPLVSQGKVIKNSEGEPEIDHDVRLRALNTLLRVSERRARLEGLDVLERARVGIEDRMVQVEEAKVELVAQALSAALTKAGLPAGEVLPLFAQELRALEAG